MILEEVAGSDKAGSGKREERQRVRRGNNQQDLELSSVCVSGCGLFQKIRCSLFFGQLERVAVEQLRGPSSVGSVVSWCFAAVLCFAAVGFSTMEDIPVVVNMRDRSRLVLGFNECVVAIEVRVRLVVVDIAV